MYERTKLKVPAQQARSDQLKIIIPCLTRMGCAFLFTAASWRGAVLPLGLCFVAAVGSGLYATCAMFGAVLGSLLLWNGVERAELVAVAVLIRAADWVFQDSDSADHRVFMPVVTATMSALIGAVLLMMGEISDWLLGLYFMRIAFCFGGTLVLQEILRHPTQESLLLLVGGLILSASQIMPIGVNIGMLLATAFAVYTAGTPTGVMLSAVCGIALDLGMRCTLPITALLCMSSLTAGLVLRRSRTLAAVTAALLFTAAAFLPTEPQFDLLGAIPGVLLGAVVPGGLYQPKPSKRSNRPKPAVRHMREAAALLDTLGEQLTVALPKMPKTDPSLIFDRTADRVCKSCSQFGICWGGASEAYAAFLGAAKPMLERGAILRDDFPIAFLGRCRHIENLLSVVNQELDSVLYRRQFRHRLETSRSLLAEQYRIFAAYLNGTAESLGEEIRKKPIYSPILGVSTEERRGNTMSGDRGASFRVMHHIHDVLLCDGMGSGQAAMEESLSTVRMLRGLLTAGFQPDDALQLLNSIYLLRDDGAFSTVDLVQMNLETGAVTLWKWGSAPTYVKRGEYVEKIGTALPPPGLEGTGKAERIELSLEIGDLLILLSDGAATPETEEQIRLYGGKSPKELASRIIDRGGDREDDRTAVVLKLQPAAVSRQHPAACAS